MKKETRGRKKLLKPSTKVSWCVPYDLYQSLMDEVLEIEMQTGVKPLISQVAYRRLKDNK